MPEYTTQFNLPKALVNENVSLSAHNSLVEAIDTNIGNSLAVHMADFTTHVADYIRQPGYAIATGAANTYAVILNPAPTTYIDGIGVAVKINTQNTGASTINVNGLGAKTIKKSNGEDIEAEDLKAGSIYTFRYNSTTGNFILQGEGGGVSSTIIKITPSLTAPANPAVGDVYVETESFGSIFMQYDDPISSAINGDIWLKISLEYLEPKLFKKGTINITSRSVNRDYGSSGEKPDVAVKIMENDLYDFYAALGMVLQRESGAWVYKKAYRWTGSVWVQISWADFYIYGGNPVCKISPDSVTTTIETPTATYATIIRINPSGKIFVADRSTTTLRCYANNGTLLWTYTPTVSTNLYGSDIAFDLSGNVYFIRSYGNFSAITEKITESGSLIGYVILPSMGIATLRIDLNNRLIVSGYNNGSGYNSLYVYTPTWETNTLGTAVWSVSLGATGYTGFVDIDSSGNIYWRCQLQAIRRYIPNGSSYTTLNPNNSDETLRFLISKTNIYVSFVYMSTDYLRTYDKDSLSNILTVSWSAESSGYYIKDLAVDPDDYVYVLEHKTNVGFRIRKLATDLTTELQSVYIGNTSSIATTKYCFDITPGRQSMFPYAW